MGRAMRTTGPSSGQSGERSKKVIQVRTKRKKRKKDLEELHRNVLEAKKNSRHEGADRKNRKSKFARILNNFADKRRENEDEIQAISEEKPRRRKRTICSRLLPIPVSGMYGNGAKGREIRKGSEDFNKMNLDRLQCNVLGLLKGDERNPRVSGDDREENDSPWIPSPVLGKARVKRINREGENRVPSLREDETIKDGGKDQLTELPRQRDEDKCKRRLFEPDDEPAAAENSFRIIDPTGITDDEIRFTPRRRKEFHNTSDQLNGCDDNGQESGQKFEAAGNRRDREFGAKLISEQAMLGSHFWGWSPVACYERLCAMICIDQFENKRYRRSRVPDRVDEIQRRLSALYVKNVRDAQVHDQEMLARNVKKARTMKTVGKNAFKFFDVKLPNASGNVGNRKNFEGTSRGKNSRVNYDSSSGSSTPLIGSWHPGNLADHDSQEESSVLEKPIFHRTRSQGGKTTRKIDGNDRNNNNNDNSNNNREDEGSAFKENAENNEESSSNNTVQETINSVALYLKKIRKEHEDALNQGNKMIFDGTEKAAGENHWMSEEKFDDYLVTPPRRSAPEDPSKTTVRKNTKHVPTILRRTNIRGGIEVDNGEQENKIQNFFHPTQDDERTMGEASKSLITANVRFPGSQFVASIEETRTKDFPLANEEIPSPSSSISALTMPEANYRLGRTNEPEINETLVERRKLDRHGKSKGNFVQRTRYKARTLASTRQDNGKTLSGNSEHWINRDATRNAMTTRNRDFNDLVEKKVLQAGKVPENWMENFGKSCRGEVKKRVQFSQNQCGFIPGNRRPAEINDEGLRKKGLRVKSNPENRESTAGNACRARKESLKSLSKFSPVKFSCRDSHRFLLDESSTDAQKRLVLPFPDDNRVQLREKRPRETLFRARSFYDPGTTALPDNISSDRISRVSSYDPSMTSTKDARSISYEDQNSLLLSENSREAKNHFPSCSNFREFSPCIDAQVSRGSCHHKHDQSFAKKPIVLFRPIHENRDQFMKPQDCNSLCERNFECNPAMKEAVRNLRIMTVDNAMSDRGTVQTSYRPLPASWNDQSHFRSDENFESHCQPSKFLAYAPTYSGNPQRIPIYESQDASRGEQRNAPGLLSAQDDRRPRTGEIFYVKSREIGERGKYFNEIQEISRNQEKLDNFSHAPANPGNFCKDSVTAGRSNAPSDHRSHKVALMMPIVPPSDRFQQTSNNNNNESLQNSYANILDSSINNQPEIVYNTNERIVTAAASKLRYPIRSLIRKNRPSDSTLYEKRSNVFPCDVHHQADNLPKRIQFPDGRIGVLLADSQNIGNCSERRENPACLITNVSVINGRNNPNIIDPRGFCNLGNEGVSYPDTEFRCHASRNPNEVVHPHRLTFLEGHSNTFDAM